MKLAHLELRAACALCGAPAQVTVETGQIALPAGWETLYVGWTPGRPGDVLYVCPTCAADPETQPFLVLRGPVDSSGSNA